MAKAKYLWNSGCHERMQKVIDNGISLFAVELAMTNLYFDVCQCIVE